MPTLDDIEELFNNCTWKWTTYNGVDGQLVIGPNGNRIFLPAAGSRYGTDFHGRGADGCYLSASSYDDSSGYACGFVFSLGYSNWNEGRFRTDGRSVRPVTE